VEFRIFDADYVEKLTAADPETEAHFSDYFGKFIFLKLRARKLSPEMIEDVRQETLLRVLRALRQGTKITQPERFGAFVNTVCHNITLEFLHKASRHPLVDEDTPERADTSIDLDAPLVTEQRRRAVAKIMDELPGRDRDLLRMVFFEELDRDEICRRMKIEPDYLRVLLHRAKARFGTAYVRKAGFLGLAMSVFWCNGLLLSFITLQRAR
jgi:RNA polymerase sigma-70 factor (ECF subfamily)